MHTIAREITVVTKNFVERHLGDYTGAVASGSDPVRVFKIDDEYPANCLVEFCEKNSGWRTVHIFLEYPDGQAVVESVKSIDGKEPMIHYVRR